MHFFVFEVMVSTTAIKYRKGLYASLEAAQRAIQNDYPNQQFDWDVEEFEEEEFEYSTRIVQFGRETLFSIKRAVVLS